MKQLTRQQAIAFAESGVYLDWSKEEIARFQLFQDRLCMDFAIYHNAVEAVLNRPVMTHELGDIERLRSEYLTTSPPPTLEEVIAMIPDSKRVII